MVDFFPGEFYINGKSSLHVFKTLIQDRPDIMAPKRKMNLVTPFAHMGALVYDEIGYENTTITLSLVTKSADSDRALYRRLLFNELSTGRYLDLEFYFDPGVIYKCILTDSYNVTNKENYEGAQTTEITLSVHPLKGFKSGMNWVHYGGVVFAPPTPTAISFPTLKIIGNGDLNLKFSISDDPSFRSNIEYKYYQFRGLDNSRELIIDNDLKLAYEKQSNGSHVYNANRKMISRDFITVSGKNYKIETVNNPSGITIMVMENWRTLI